MKVMFYRYRKMYEIEINVNYYMFITKKDICLYKDDYIKFYKVNRKIYNLCRLFVKSILKL